MRRNVLGLSLSLAFAALPAPLRAGAAPPAITITYAEHPVVLWRDTSLHSAGRGTALLPNDLLDTGTATIQLGAGASLIALGPASRVYVKSAVELVLLKGWLKVRGAPAHGVRLATAQLHFDSIGATVTLHAAPESSELFSEAGELLVTELAAGKAPHATRVPREQFGAKSGMLPLKLAARPPPSFLTAMPRTFFDALVALPPAGPAVLPRRERAATFDELAPLVAGHPALRQQVQRRFQGAARGARSRLTNDLFRGPP